MPDYTKLPIGDRAPQLVNAVIEIPKDSVNKYEYDKQLHVFRLDRTLFSPVHYPGDYGFLPCTLGNDGDPLDVLVLVEAPSFPGCLMEVRPIGVLQGLQASRIPFSMCASYKAIAKAGGWPHVPEVETATRTHLLQQRLAVEGYLPAGYATEDGVGLHYVGTELREAVSVLPGKHAWHVAPDGQGGYTEQPITPRLIGEG